MIIAVKGIHIFLKIAQAVLHAVGKFAEDNRLTAVHLRRNGLIVRRQLISQVFKKADGDLPLLTQRAELVLRGVHAADEVGLCQIKIALVVDGPAVVQLQHTLAHFHEVIAVPRLIPEGPERHAGMVSVAQDHTLRPIHHCLCPHRIAPGDPLTPHAVRLYIALVHHVKAHLIAQIIKVRIVRIMAGTDGVDVRPFH